MGKRLTKPALQRGTRLYPKKLLGKYRLQKRLGKGGYCEVWKARDSLEGIWVALKIPLPDIAGKRDNETIFREIRLVSQLRHPHIMPVKNADIIDQHAVMATELSVKTLDDCSRPMGVSRLLSIIRQVLDGLSYAHQKRIVHCDVTPGNIFLFANGRAAIGDFGIGILVKGRAKTIDDYGTPGYVAPEQAFGKPTFRSDCFSVALILYEFLTGVLPRWPFQWPPRGLERLRERTNQNFVRFMEISLCPDPQKRFPNAKQMLSAMDRSMPSGIRQKLLRNSKQAIPDWKQLRRQTFMDRYRQNFIQWHPCCDCGEPLAEPMQTCPWCGTQSNRFDDCTIFSHLCHRCHRGVAPEWHYCPWCYGAGFEPQKPNGIIVEYQAKCDHCSGKMMPFMKYCPWCHRKPNKKWQIWPFPEICGSCGWSVDSDYWIYCPWCSSSLV